jgi:uncharacterized protein (TIGR02246 family)
MKVFPVIAAATWLTLASCRSENIPQEVNMPALRKAISDANSAYILAYEKSDAHSLAGLFTEDATMLQPNVDPVKGRDKFLEQITSMMRHSAFQDWKITILDVSASGTMACEIGKYAYTLRPQGKEPVSISGKYVTVWKQQPDGSWKIAVRADQPND